MKVRGASLGCSGLFLSLLLAMGYSNTVLDNRKVCLGTDNRFSKLGGSKEHYNFMQKMFKGCEIVLGNLEITHLLPQHDTSFLKDIKEVGGYVLIGLNAVRSISLTNLTVIRGNNLIKGAALNILANYLDGNREIGLEELPMRQLKEILQGGVKIFENFRLCNLDTINWHDIVDKEKATIEVITDTQRLCPKCDTDCGESCWAPGPENCQKLTKLNCAQHCPGRCKGPMASDCCHSQCAAGCTGHKENACLACRKFRDDNACTESCPPLQLYNSETYQLELNPNGKYTFGASCVNKCPHNYIMTDLGSCVQTCPSDSFEVEKNGVRSCKKCDGHCSKDVICDGIGQGHLKKVIAVNGTNIHFFKNCTIIQGNLIFLTLSGHGDAYTNTSKVELQHLEIFKTIREITGFLLIQWWPTNFTDLSVFENLEIIRGRKKHLGRYSLAVAEQSIDSLGLRSLKEVSDGDIIFKRNRKLCYIDSFNWTAIFRAHQETIFLNNSSPEECRSAGNVCDPLCSDQGCWGPGPTQCFSCQIYNRGRECVSSCNIITGEPREYIDNDSCFPCHPECLVQNNSVTCIAPGADQCMKCAHYTDEDGTCVSFCFPTIPDGSYSIYSKYPDANGICHFCSPECKTGCTGPGPEGCKHHGSTPAVATEEKPNGNMNSD